jgi:anti-sigma factor RsiW
MSGVFDEHLTLDAVVAFADGEMSLVPYQRAAAHIMACPACAGDVAEQTAASQYLRQASLPRMPGSLFDTLKSIPVALPPRALVPSVMLDSASGRTVRADDRSAAAGRGRRFRLGAGALMAGLAVGAVVVVASGDQPTLPNRPLLPDASAVSRPAAVLQTVVVNVVARSTPTR